MTYAIKNLFHIDSTPAQVFAAITSIDGLSNWWTVDTSGDAAVGGQIKFNFGAHAGPLVEVIEVVPHEKVVWRCISSEHGWVGNTFTFLLDENEGKTRVRFTHDGFPAQDDFYAICNFSWGRYMQSLRQYCQTGIGAAFGSATYA